MAKQVTKSHQCTRCNGDGFIKITISRFTARYTCDSCNGSGHVEIKDYNGGN